MDVSIVGGPIVLENVFVHEGESRHEILFIFDVKFPPGAFDGQESFQFQKDDDTWPRAGWYDPGEFDIEGKPDLYPKSLKSHLSLRAVGQTAGPSERLTFLAC